MKDDSKQEPTVRDRGGKHLGPARTSPYPVSRLAPAYDLVDVAKRIADADLMVGAVANAKLRVIAEQIRALQEQARVVLDEAREDLDLHRAQCAFIRKPGQVYHLYQREDGGRWFSMIGPDEWGSRGSSSEFVGSYRMEVDQSWTRVDVDSAKEQPEAPEELVRHLLGS